LTLLYEAQIDGPVTHAFIMGCGRYPYLQANHAADRRAPVAGAIALAKMLLDDRDRLVAPLGSLEMLLSDPNVNDGSVDIGNVLGGDVVTTVVEAADEQHFRDRGDDWLGRIRPGDAVVFYFSGHGIADRQGGAVGLLEDIKSKTNRPWAQSFSASNLSQALQTLHPASAWVFFDGCQEIVAEFADRLWEVKNIDLKEVSLADITGDVCEPLAIAGSRTGHLAWAPADFEPPFFTQVLIKGLSGCCVERTQSHGWAVTGRMLLFGLRQLGETMFDHIIVKPQPILPYSEMHSLMTVEQPFMHLAVRSIPEVHLTQMASVQLKHQDLEIMSSVAAEFVWRVDVNLEDRDLTVECVCQQGAAPLVSQTFRQQAPSFLVTLRPAGDAA
jgi:hypothetical protein